MSTRLAWVCVMVCMLGGCQKGEALGPDGKPTVAKVADSDLIQGRWEVVTLQRGSTQGALPGPGVGFEFVDDLALRLEDGKPHGPRGPFKLDAGRQPKWIDITDRASERTMRGIYELTNEQLRICVNDRPPDDKHRPTTFDIKAGNSNGLVMVLKRMK